MRTKIRQILNVLTLGMMTLGLVIAPTTPTTAADNSVPTSALESTVSLAPVDVINPEVYVDPPNARVGAHYVFLFQITTPLACPGEVWIQWHEGYTGTSQIDDLGTADLDVANVAWSTVSRSNVITTADLTFIPSPDVSVPPDGMNTKVTQSWIPGGQVRLTISDTHGVTEISAGTWVRVDFWGPAAVNPGKDDAGITNPHSAGTYCYGVATDEEQTLVDVCFDITPPEAIITGTKMAPDSASFGEVITYRISIQNDGGITGTVELVEDIVPDGVAYVEHQSPLSYTAGAPERLFWYGDLGPGEITALTWWASVTGEISDTVFNEAVIYTYETLTITAGTHITTPEPCQQVLPPIATLCTSAGPPITDRALRNMLDMHIPNYQSTLLIFTQCYGGDMLQKFKDRQGTGILSATSISQTAVYGGYDDDAAGALWPGQGRTSDNVHKEGRDGKHEDETPIKAGDTISLTPTSPTGEIKSRHVLVYAGCPDIGGTWDSDQRETIKGNFPGAPTTTVTTVGGNGAPTGWNYPGTLNGLRDALIEIGGKMNKDEQFILFVTDHGDKHPAVGELEIPSYPEEYYIPITVTQRLINDMLNDPYNEPGTGITFFQPGSDPFEGVISLTLATTTTTYTDFTDFSVDLNGDGDLEDLGEGHYFFFPVPESVLIPPVANEDFLLEINVENGTSEDLYFAYVSMDSGPISKIVAQNYIYLPLIMKNYGD